jgi:osmotically inducible protein OsmC
VPRVEQTAEVSWEGNVARGNGSISASTGAFTGLPYSVATRIARVEGRTSPEELLAAAHAGCFAMSLANELSRAGSAPERLDVEATVTLDEVPGVGHRIVASSVRARARVPGLEAAELDRLAAVADEGCTFSALLRASATVTVNAELEEAS